mmetsp:Transcript_7265/g.12486  ORF Transcript_7265/g.12486 Transcript_7265/m.12486 type:complete len:97 (+) Transcript_7265:173-463(+)
MAVSFAFDFVCCMLSRLLLHKNRIATICVSIVALASPATISECQKLFALPLSELKTNALITLAKNQAASFMIKNRIASIAKVREDLHFLAASLIQK